jgi:acyl-CoA synthetase (NDP forming)
VAATGNEADLDTADFVAALAQRPGVRLILLYLEHVADAQRMRSALQTARRQGVRVVAVRAGRSADGCRSAALHTGSSGAGSDALDVLFADCGCRTVGDMGEMLRCVPGYLALAGQHGVAAPRLVVVSNSGASCVIAADVATRVGIPLAELSSASQAQLSELLPDFSLNRNPIDLTAMLLAKPSLLGDVVQCAMADPAADCVLLGLLAIGGPSYDVDRFARDCSAAVQASGKALWVYSPHTRVREAFSAQGMPVFAGEAEALREIAGHAEHLSALAVSEPPSQPANPEPETVHA